MPSANRYPLVTFLPDLLEDSGAVTRVNRSVRKLGLHLAQITEAGTCHPAGPVVLSAVPCIRRPGRKGCTGHIAVQRSEVPPEIRWSCQLCGDQGVITGWEDSLFDYRDEVATPEKVSSIEVRIPDETFQILRRDGVLAIKPCRLLAAATCDGSQVLLRGTEEEFDELAEQVAAESSQEGVRRRQFLLDEAFHALDTAVRRARGLEPSPSIPDLTEEDMLDLFQNVLPPGLRDASPHFDELVRRGATDAFESIQFHRRIDSVLAVPFIEYRYLGVFMRTLEDTADAILRFSETSPEMALGVFRYFLAALPKLRGEVQDETEMLDFCAHMCRDSLAVSARTKPPRRGPREMIAAILDAYRADESMWFEFVPDLLRSLNLGKRERSWLAKQIGSLAPARDRAHQRELERLLGELTA